MPKTNGSFKLICTLVAALGIPALGVGGYYELRERTQAITDRINTVEVRHVSDRSELHSDITTLRCLVDTLMATASQSAAKIDLVLDMLKEHTRAERDANP